MIHSYTSRVNVENLISLISTLINYIRLWKIRISSLVYMKSGIYGDLTGNKYRFKDDIASLLLARIRP